MNQEKLCTTAQALVAPGKGILAADESTGTITRRFQSVGVESTVATRRAYRDLLLTAAGAEAYISGVILFDETIRQTSLSGVLFTQLLSERGMIPGIKVDLGAKALAGFPGEQITEGLDGLRERLAAYVELGARFAKWRAVLTIGEELPTPCCIEANAHALARYAALCQDADLVPIVEPEVLMEGSNTIARCEAVTTTVLAAVFTALRQHRVLLEGLLLKPNMVIAGKRCPVQNPVEEVASATVRTLMRTVPAAVPGIVFLSGGQAPEQATAHLNAMNKMGPFPWELSFSFGRALQDPALKAWAGDPAHVSEAQALYLKRARLNSAARSGRYDPADEQPT